MTPKPILPAAALAPNPTQALRAPAAASGAADFVASLEAALKSVSAQQQAASQSQRAFQAGDPAVGLEETMVAMSKAQISFQATVQVRNKLVQAYESVMNMPV